MYMADNLFLGMATMVICLVIQSLLGALAVYFYARMQTVQLRARSFTRTMSLLVVVMLVLLVGNLIQVAVWAQLFIYLDEFQSYADAVYHSAVNFATLGYGDIVMSERHRLLGPMQAINGVLMVGVSTAVVMAALQDALRAVTGDEY
jgi:hypothetical protein